MLETQTLADGIALDLFKDGARLDQALISEKEGVWTMSLRPWQGHASRESAMLAAKIELLERQRAQEAS